MTGKPLIALAAVVAAGLVLVTAALLAHRPSAHPGPTSDNGGPLRPRPSTAAPKQGSPPTTGVSTTAAEMLRLLPLGTGQIAAAVETARRFTAAYLTWRYDESPQTYLARLTPAISPGLRPQLERAATDPTTTTQRRRLQQTSTGQARAEAIRALAPGSITVIVTGTQHLSTSHTTWQETSRYAVTLTHHTPNSGRGWRVYAFDLAATGDAGDVPDNEHTKNKENGENWESGP